VPVADLCYENGMMPLPGNGLTSNHERERLVLQMASEVWRDALLGFCFAKPYRVTDASLINQMKAIEDEYRRLKRMNADLSMQADLLKEALGKK
jgi:hypothetical protein